MAKGKKHTPEQIVSLLRQIEVAVGTARRLRSLAGRVASPNRLTIGGARSLVACR
jgi:hypothetical protein